MKRIYILILLISTTLYGCSQQKEINVTLDLEIEEQEGTVQILGETNLPNNTNVSISLINKEGEDIDFNNQTVQDGKFKSWQLSNEGSPLGNGTYIVEVITPTANVQPNSVKKAFGKDGKNLVGDLIKNDSIFGNMVRYEKSFTIANSNAFKSTTPTHDDIYKFMVDSYNQITNYGENYVPEYHDAIVSKMASEKFGISNSEADRIYIEKEMSK